MKIASALYLVLTALSWKSWWLLLALTGMLMTFYNEDTSFHYESGSASFSESIDQKLEGLRQYSIPLTLLSIFPIALLASMPRAFATLFGTNLPFPKVLTMIHSAILLIGAFLALGASLILTVADRHLSFSPVFLAGALFSAYFLNMLCLSKRSSEQGAAANP